jgi:pimeloyl-ACP methyl ester carboxylesterase
LLESLAVNYHPLAFVQRPLWQGSHAEDIIDWLPLTDDLLAMVGTEFKEAVIAIGHSMGGIALLRAALRSPDRFRAAILIDPVLFPPATILIWSLIHALGLEAQAHPLVPATRHRRQVFNDLEKLFQGYRRKSIFKYMDDSALKAYIMGITCRSADGYHLCYSAEWEERIYTTSVWRDLDIWRTLPDLQVPTLILRGAHTDTFWGSTSRLAQKKSPRLQVLTVENSTHLLPLEQPAVVANLIFSFLQECL